MKDKTYSEKLKHPLWQKKRLEIMSRDNFTCKKCGDTETELHVHHIEYGLGDPWMIDNKFLITLCADCHQIIEKFKNDEPNVPFDKISIYKSDKWSTGSKIIFTSIPKMCNMTIYDDQGQWLCGYNFSGSSLKDTISILKKAQHV